MNSHAGWLRRAGTELKGFCRSQTGLVTVEWVALAGAIAIGAIVIGWYVVDQLKTPAAAVATAAQTATSSR